MTTITVDGAALAHAAGWVGKAIPNRPTAPVLAAMRLDEVVDGRIRLTGFDYENSATATLEVDGSLPTTLVNGHLFASIAGDLKGDVTLTVDGGRLLVKNGRAVHRLALMPAEDYPALPATPVLVATLEADALRDAVNGVAAFVGNDKTLPVLTGINLVIGDDGWLQTQATDRFRAGVYSVPVNGEAGPVSVIVPGRHLVEYAKTAAGQVNVHTDGESLAVFTDANRSASMRLYSGEFPKVDRLFRAESPNEAWVDRGQMLALVKAASVTAGRQHHIDVTVTDGTITVASSEDDNETTVDGDAVVKGEPLGFRVSADYLRDAANAIATNYVHIGHLEAVKPLMIGGADEVGDSPAVTQRTILMPLRKGTHE